MRSLEEKKICFVALKFLVLVIRWMTLLNGNRECERNQMKNWEGSAIQSDFF